MNPLIQPKKTTPLIVILLSLAYFSPAPLAQAVVPPPDGGYPNFTTAEGTNALPSLTTGSANTAVGWFSLWGNAEGSFNTATGAGALLFNTADENTAFGAAALLFNTIGERNTAVEAAALLNNMEGNVNTAINTSALFSNTTGNENTAVGDQALHNNTSGEENTALGSSALGNNPSGNFNTAVGAIALLNTTGTQNTGVGVNTLGHNTSGNSNTAIGTNALVSSTGSGKTALGFNAGLGVTTANNVICIRASGANVDNSCFIGNISGADATGGDPVFITNDGKLGTVNPPSSARFKEDIKPMDKASEVILALKPVTFRYKRELDAKRIPQFGLVAEEVEKVNPDLAKRDRDGKLQTVRYDAINAMLLNEFLKEHHKVQEQGATITQQRKDFETAIAQQQKEIEALTATVKQQAVQIQKVSAQLEASKPAPQMVNNP